VPTPLRRPDELEYAVFRGSDAVRDGLLTPKALRGPGWTRLRYDVYADSRLEHDHELACRAAALMLPESAVIAGRSAAYLLGVEHAASFATPIHVIIPPAAPRPRGHMVVHRTEVEAHHIAQLPWARQTDSVRTAWDLASWHDLAASVSVLDTMLGRGITNKPELLRMLAEHECRRGVRKARRAFGLADGRAQSPRESQMRVRLVLAGLPVPVPQFPVHLDSGLVLHPDVAWPDYKVGAEYDGRWHERALNLDRRRHNAIQCAGWRIVYLTSERMANDFRGFVREVRGELMARGWRPTAAKIAASERHLSL
jgi:hypothetical protein